MINRYGFWVPERNFHQSDEIIHDVYFGDAYRTGLRSVRGYPEYVVDVGANIGTFSKRWRERNPLAKIACVEVNEHLLASLWRNVGDFAEVIPKACHYGENLRLLDAVTGPASRSLGGSVVCSEEQQRNCTDPQYYHEPKPVETITLEKIQERYGWPYIDVLKLDCEGSEFSILEHCDLSRIGFIFVESHGVARWRDLLVSRFAGWHSSRMHANGECEIWHLANQKNPRC